MKAPLRQTVTKATQTADLLASEIRAAQSRSCGENPALEILLRDLIYDAMKLKNRLAEIEACLK